MVRMAGLGVLVAALSMQVVGQANPTKGADAAASQNRKQGKEHRMIATIVTDA